jgi:hypothetical protein
VADSNIVLNEHYEGDGEIIFKHACKLGCEGIAYQNGLARCIALDARRIGSKSKIRMRLL